MARIRTIKPSFFTSADVCALSPLARLFFITTWLEADREGRFPWKPANMKLRYFPTDAVDITLIADELVTRGLVTVYRHRGVTYAEIPTFKDHQTFNSREAKSIIPSPWEADDTALHVHARESTRKIEGKGKEGKGRERKDTPLDTSLRSVSPPHGGAGMAKVSRQNSGTRWPDGEAVPEEWRDKMRAALEARGLSAIDLDLEAIKFANHWISSNGANARKRDWQRTWINWVLTAAGKARRP